MLVRIRDFRAMLWARRLIVCLARFLADCMLANGLTPVAGQKGAVFCGFPDGLSTSYTVQSRIFFVGKEAALRV